jgi:hypothetical protein
VSAFGVVLIGFGVLMIYSGIHNQRVNEVLLAFVSKPSAKSQQSTFATSAGVVTGAAGPPGTSLA